MSGSNPAWGFPSRTSLLTCKTGLERVRFSMTNQHK